MYPLLTIERKCYPPTEKQITGISPKKVSKDNCVKMKP